MATPSAHLGASATREAKHAVHLQAFGALGAFAAAAIYSNRYTDEFTCEFIITASAAIYSNSMPVDAIKQAEFIRSNDPASEGSTPLSTKRTLS